jgi:hypothetical protein
MKAQKDLEWWFKWVMPEPSVWKIAKVAEKEVNGRNQMVILFSADIDAHLTVEPIVFGKNKSTLIDLFGDETDAWVGKEVSLWREDTIDKKTQAKKSILHIK